MNAITKLSFNTIKTHRVRSAIVCTAIILTSVLFMTIMSIVSSIFGEYQLMLQLAGGSDFHACYMISDFDASPDELLSRVKKNGAVAEAYLLVTYGEVTSEPVSVSDSNNVMVALDSKKATNHLFTKITDGKFPQTENEIAINAAFYPDIELGQHITLSRSEMLQNEDDTYAFNTVENEYTVSGIFKSDVDSKAQTSLISLCKPADGDSCKSGQIFIVFHNAINIQGKLDVLSDSLSDISGGTAISGEINNAFFTADISSFLQPANIALILFAVSVVFFCAFLLIYNIYSIALTQDIHTLGQLNVIGTTYRQLSSMIRQQTLMLYAISIPIGLILGYLIGWRLLSPIFMTMSGSVLPYRFNIWIPLLSAVLTLFTLIFSALRPMHKIKKMTPIETLNGFSSVLHTVKSSRSERMMNPALLSFLSAVRNPKRLATMSLSISLSIILFIIISSTVSAMYEGSLDEMIIPDIVLSPTDETQGGGVYKVTSLLGSESGVIDESLYHTIKESEYAGEVYAVRRTLLSVDGNDRIMSEASKMLAKAAECGIDDYENFTSVENAVNGTVDSVFISIPDALCKYILIDDNEYYSGSELYDGTHVIAVPATQGAIYLPEEIDSNDSNKEYREYYMQEYFNDDEIISSDELSKDYTVIAAENIRSYRVLDRICGYTRWQNYTQIFVMPESVYEKEFGYTPIFELLCNYKSDSFAENDGEINRKENEFRREVNDMVAEYVADRDTSGDIGDAYGIKATGRFDAIDSLHTRLYALKTTGYGLSAIIFLIGAINMVNSSLAAVMLRRREYAMLESVGMTDGQLRTMMLLEGFAGGMIAAAISMLFGIPLTKLLIVKAFESDVQVNWGMAAVMLCVLFVLSAATSLWSFLSTKRVPLTERLKADE